MAQPTNRKEFTEWCLRKLGKPVIEINVDVDQVDDRIDESLSYYYDYHFDGAEKTYYKHLVTDTDVSNQYITLPENILGVVKIFDQSVFGLSSADMFNPRYQFMLNHMNSVNGYDLVTFRMSMQHLALLEDTLSTKTAIRFNRHRNRLHLDTNWANISVGSYLVVEAYQVVDPNEFSDVWKDRWLQEYASAKIQMQWGQNLLKFQNVQLVGGLTFNGREIYDEAKERINKLEEEMISTYSVPLGFEIG